MDEEEKEMKILKSAFANDDDWFFGDDDSKENVTTLAKSHLNEIRDIENVS